MVTPFFLTGISDDGWLHSLQHIFNVGCVVGKTSAACKKGVGNCREAVEVGGVPELGVVDREDEGELDQGFEWLGSPTDQ